MPGSEGLRRLDPHRGQPFGHIFSGMAAIDVEAAGNNRGETFERFCDPVDLGVDGLDGEAHFAAQNLAREGIERLDIGRTVARGFEHPLAGFFIFMRRSGQRQLVALGHGVDQRIGLFLAEGNGKLVN